MKLTRQMFPLFCLLILAGFITSCSSSEEVSDTSGKPEMEDAVFERVDKEESIIPETDLPNDAQPVPAEAPRTQTTVPVPQREMPASQQPPVAAPQTNVPPSAAPQSDQPAATSAPRTGAMMWSVQLGAFKSESGALQLIEEAKQKFNQPVYKRYDAVTGFYKVTLGSYQTRDDASRFKLDVQSRGYPDAFVVEVAR